VAATARRGKIFVIGGFAENRGTVATVEVYDIASDSWNTGPPLPLAVNHAMSATLDGVVYVFGGYIGGGETTRRAFALRDGRWRELPRMPEVRAAGGVGAVRGKLFIVGGVGPDGLADNTMVFDPGTRRWSTRGSLPTQRQHLGATGARRRVWVVAGRRGGLDTNMATFERYVPRTRGWRQLPDIPTARGGLAAAATRNGFVVAAGGEAPNRTFDEVEAFDIVRGRWRSLPPMPTARHGLGVVAVGNTIYVLAGGPEPGLTYSDANESLDLSSLR
jgi:N-acetylneuraminic acid mutarotase